jgi:hypothetical protein
VTEVIAFPDKAAPPITRPAKFAIELEAKLKTYTDRASKIRFLQALLHNWELRYRHFDERVASGEYEDRPGGPTAWDYSLTIAEIACQLSKAEME